MHYSKEEAEDIERERPKVIDALSSMWIDLAHALAPSLRSEKARQYVIQGMCRRLITIRRCITNIFTVFPVNRDEFLTDDERSDVETYLHAFFINVHGLLDNLAWVYFLERNVAIIKPTEVLSYRDELKRGSAIRRSDVGIFLRKSHEHFPDEVRSYLTSDAMTAWHQAYAKNYRDALAHQIPLYVPPSIVPSEYGDLYVQFDAAMKKGDFESAYPLYEEIICAGDLCPAFAYSLSGEAPAVPLHPQIIVDAKTAMQAISMLRPHLQEVAPE
jgi:hypothetical protein